MAPFPDATPHNDYLGFCKAAWNLQKDDRKPSFRKVREPLVAYSRSGSNNKTTTPYYLQCRESGCSFRSREIPPYVEFPWSRVFEYPDIGIKLRWTFFAKSHVRQQVAAKAQHSFKCLFCVYLGSSAQVYGGMSSCLHHINAEHRGKEASSVVEDKLKCINNRIAQDHEDFDINLWPSTASGPITSREWIYDPEDPILNQRNRSVDSTNGADTSEDPQSGEGSKAGLDSAGEKASMAAAAERLFKLNSQGSYVNRSGPWYDVETNPWAVDDPLRLGPSQLPAVKPSVDTQASPQYRDEVVLSLPPVSVEVPVLPPAKHSPRRPTEGQTGVQHVRDALEQADPPSDVEDSLTECLDEIVAMFKEALAYVEEIKQHAHRTAQQPPDQMLEEVLRDAPMAIEKQRSRCLAQYGDSFETADPHTVGSLQRVVTRLGSRLLRPLRQMAAGSDSSGDGHALMREADSGQIKTTTILYERGERLRKQFEGALKPSLSPSPHTLQARNAGYSLGASRAPSDDSARPSHFSDDSLSGVDPERQASLASTSSGSHQSQAQDRPAGSRRRSSVLANLFKHGRMSGSEANQATQPDFSSGVVKRMEFRHKRSEGPYPPGARAAELDSTPVLQKE